MTGLVSARGRGSAAALKNKKPQASSAASERVAAATKIELDPFRAFVFPNRIREQRRQAGYPKLLALANTLPEITYIRLSKIERGEVFPRADELACIAAQLNVAASKLLIDIDSSDFDIAQWAEPFRDNRPSDPEEDQLAVLVAATLRARRHYDRSLTLAVLDREYGLPAVVLSRLENAQKPLGRWNTGTLSGLCSVFAVPDLKALRQFVREQHARGELNDFLAAVTSPLPRLTRTRERVALLRAELTGHGSSALPADSIDPAPSTATVPLSSPATSVAPLSVPAADQAPVRTRQVPVYGTALPDGLIAETLTGTEIEVATTAGPRSYGLRVCRATLGGGLPASATAIVDPDRYPLPGGLAVVREQRGLRIVAVTLSRTGALVGYSNSPDFEVALDTLPPSAVAAVVGASFV